MLVAVVLDRNDVAPEAQRGEHQCAHAEQSQHGQLQPAVREEFHSRGGIRGLQSSGTLDTRGVGDGGLTYGAGMMGLAFGADCHCGRPT